MQIVNQCEVFRGDRFDRVDLCRNGQCVQGHLVEIVSEQFVERLFRIEDSSYRIGQTVCPVCQETLQEKPLSGFQRLVKLIIDWVVQFFRTLCGFLPPPVKDRRVVSLFCGEASHFLHEGCARLHLEYAHTCPVDHATHFRYPLPQELETWASHYHVTKERLEQLTSDFLFKIKENISFFDQVVAEKGVPFESIVSMDEDHLNFWLEHQEKLVACLDFGIEFETMLHLPPRVKEVLFDNFASFRALLQGGYTSQEIFGFNAKLLSFVIENVEQAICLKTSQIDLVKLERNPHCDLFLAKVEAFIALMTHGFDLFAMDSMRSLFCIEEASSVLEKKTYFQQVLAFPTSHFYTLEELRFALDFAEAIVHFRSLGVEVATIYALRSTKEEMLERYELFQDLDTLKVFATASFPTSFFITHFEGACKLLDLGFSWENLRRLEPLMVEELLGHLGALPHISYRDKLLLLHHANRARVYENAAHFNRLEALTAYEINQNPKVLSCEFGVLLDSSFSASRLYSSSQLDTLLSCTEWVKEMVQQGADLDLFETHPALFEHKPRALSFLKARGKAFIMSLSSEELTGYLTATSSSLYDKGVNLWRSLWSSK